MNKEDNPVPSLVIEFNDNENIGWIQALEKELILKYPHQIKKTKLQNGVETNNEKPKVQKDPSSQCCDL